MKIVRQMPFNTTYKWLQIKADGITYTMEERKNGVERINIEIYIENTPITRNNGARKRSRHAADIQLFTISMIICSNIYKGTPLRLN